MFDRFDNNQPITIPLGDYNPWGDDGKTPTYDICPCCGVE